MDFLSEKGIEVIARPTTKIDNATYQVLLDEFETDKSKRDASQEISEEKRKEKERLREIQEQKEQERLHQLEVQKEAEREEEAKAASPKVALKGLTPVGKIDLEATKAAPKKAKKETSKKEEVSPEPAKAPEAILDKEEAPEVKTEEVIAETPAKAVAEQAVSASEENIEDEEGQEAIKTQYKSFQDLRKQGRQSTWMPLNPKRKV